MQHQPPGGFGHLGKFIGDAVMAVWGAPVAAEGGRGAGGPGRVSDDCDLPPERRLILAAGNCTRTERTDENANQHWP